jgi:hypothetical protein
MKLLEEVKLLLIVLENPKKLINQDILIINIIHIYLVYTKDLL